MESLEMFAWLAQNKLWQITLAGMKGVPVEKLKTMRLHKKDFKRGGEALRGKNVTDNFRVKEKDVKRTMK